MSFLLVGSVIGGLLGWTGAGCASAATAAARTGLVHPYAGECEQARLTTEDLRALVDAELRYSPGDSPRQTTVVFRRDGERANLELVEDGHFDDSVRGESRFFELRYDNGGWSALTCAHELSCYRGKSGDSCN